MHGKESNPFNSGIFFSFLVLRLSSGTCKTERSTRSLIPRCWQQVLILVFVLEYIIPVIPRTCVSCAEVRDNIDCNSCCTTRTTCVHRKVLCTLDYTCTDSSIMTFPLQPLHSETSRLLSTSHSLSHIYIPFPRLSSLGSRVLITQA